MSAKLNLVPSINGFSTTLDGDITAGDTNITLTSVTGLNSSGGILGIDRVNSSGVATPSQREYWSFTGITTKTCTGVTRGLAGSTAQAHTSGAIVEALFTVTHFSELIEFLEVSHAADGTIKSGATLTSPVINTAISGTAFLDEDDMASNSATKVASQQSIKAYVDAGVTTDTSDTTPTPTGGKKRNEYYMTALAGAAEFQAPSGTPANGNTLIIRVKDDGTARALTWNAIYDGFADDLPATTTLGKTLYLAFLYNSASSKWDLMATREAS